MSTTDDDRRTFDPRFDPAFQPGYDPRNDPTIAARATPTRASSDTRTASAPPAPLQVPAALESPARGRRRADDPGDALDDPLYGSDGALDGALDGVEETDDAADTGAPARGVNPFLIALWAFSLLTIVAGIVLFRSLPGLESALRADPEGEVSYFQLDTIAGIDAALFGVGLAAAAIALAVHAAQWKGRRPGA